MAAQWLTSVSFKSGRDIRHQPIGREKRIGKLLGDGWCAETRTAYQFHGCYFHCCRNCYDPQETNTLNGKTMAQLLDDTTKNTTYLRRHVEVVAMWECQWKQEAKVPPHPKWTMTQNEILTAVVDGTLFGMIECGVRIPVDLREHFVEMLPVFKTRMCWLLETILVHTCDRSRVQVIEYEANSWFQRFGESVSTARRAGDEDPDKAIIADTMKLLGNSGYGKMLTNIDRNRNVQYCTKSGTSSLINNKRFRQLEVVTDNAYAMEMSKGVVTYTLPLHIGFFVYQYAKLRMLQFCYDFVDRYVERPLFQYCEMDTDSAYIALAGESIDDLAVDRENYF